MPTRSAAGPAKKPVTKESHPVLQAGPFVPVVASVTDENVLVVVVIDIAVRYGGGNWPGLEVILLMNEEVFPVCSPKLLEGGHPLRTVGDLRYYTLIHDDSMPAVSAFPQWAVWLEAAGAPGIDATRGLHVDTSMLAIQAAIDGQGVVLGRSVLVHDDLATRLLVKPFDLTFPLRFSRFSYYIVYPRKLQAVPAVQAFKRWLLAEAAAKERP